MSKAFSIFVFLCVAFVGGSVVRATWVGSGHDYLLTAGASLMALRIVLEKAVETWDECAA